MPSSFPLGWEKPDPLSVDRKCAACRDSVQTGRDQDDEGPPQ